MSEVNPNNFDGVTTVVVGPVVTSKASTHTQLPAEAALCCPLGTMVSVCELLLRSLIEY